MKRQMTALLLAAVMLLAGGCSPQGDISKRSIVTAAAVVLTGEGEYQLSVEYLTQLSSDEQSWEYRAGSGSSFAQAVTAIELASGKSLYLDGCKVLVVEGTDSRRQLQGLLEEIDARYVGLLRFSRRGLEVILDIMDKAHTLPADAPWQQSGKPVRKAYMTDLLQALIEAGEQVRAVPFRHGWVEFDTNEDYETACRWAQDGTLGRFVELL